MGFIKHLWRSILCWISLKKSIVRSFDAPEDASAKIEPWFEMEYHVENRVIDSFLGAINVVNKKSEPNLKSVCESSQKSKPT